MTSQMEFDLCLKIIIVGDSGVGKTNILTRFTKNQFNYENKTTIGVEFASKIISIQDHSVKLQIWDTAGQERYKSITVAYYKGSKGAFIVFDVTRKETFNNVLKWYNDIKQNGEKDVTIILVGNKSDLEERAVSFEEAKNFAEMYKIGYVETSALNMSNIEYAFTLLSENIFEVILNNHQDYEEDGIQINDGKNLSLIESNKQEDKVEKKSCCY